MRWNRTDRAYWQTLFLSTCRKESASNEIVTRLRGGNYAASSLSKSARLPFGPPMLPIIGAAQRPTVASDISMVDCRRHQMQCKTMKKDISLSKQRCLRCRSSSGNWWPDEPNRLARLARNAYGQDIGNASVAWQLKSRSRVLVFLERDHESVANLPHVIIYSRCPATCPQPKHVLSFRGPHRYPSFRSVNDLLEPSFSPITQLRDLLASLLRP